MYCLDILMFVRVPGPVVSPLKTSCACDDEQPRRAHHGTTKWTDRIQSREGGGSKLPIFRWVCVSDDPKLWPITEAKFHEENL